MAKRGEGVSRFLVENLLSHNTEKIRRGTLLCFRKLLVSKKFMDRRGEYHDLPSKACCLKVPKKFVDETFCVSEKFCNGMLSKTLLCFKLFRYRKMLQIREGAGIKMFQRNFLYSIPKSFVREPFLVSEKILVSKLLMHRRGSVSRFPFVIFRFKEVGKGWDSNPHLPLQKLLSYPLCHGNHWKF